MMTTILIILTATLLIVCFLLFAVLLGAHQLAEKSQRRVEELESERQTWRTIERQMNERLSKTEQELKSKRAALEMTSEELTTGARAYKIARDERRKYRDMLEQIAIVFAEEKELYGQVLWDQCDPNVRARRNTTHQTKSTETE